MSNELDSWISAQWRASAAGLRRSISPTLTKERPGFGQTVTARRGCVVASPVLAAYDPDPDYFFHWYRDSSLVIDALRLLREEPGQATVLTATFHDFVRFGLELLHLDGESLVQSGGWRERVTPGFQRYLRSPEELKQVKGVAVSAETRVNPDGTLDISQWARPQHDGPATRALALLRWLRLNLPHAVRADARTLLHADLDFVRQVAQTPCFDIWEEESGLHYYTLRVCAAALKQGAEWLERHEQASAAADLGHQARVILGGLDQFWLPREGYYASRQLPDGRHSDKALDIAVLLASLHVADAGAAHGFADPRLEATFEQLVRLFATEYPLNRELPGDAPAMGRYAGDHYYSGGPYYFSTLGAAEYCYRRAALGPAAPWRSRGDRFLETVRRYTPPNGELAEQFDRSTGAPCSAKQLAWSYAAFLTCANARRALG